MTSSTLIAYLIIIIFTFWGMYKLYKLYITGQKTDKILIIIVSIAIFTPIVTYLIDRYNIPTLLTWNTQNIETENWMSFLSTYVAEIFGASIGVIAMYYTTKKQIDETNKANELNAKKDKRINNQPILEYYFDEPITTKNARQTIVLKTKYPEENSTNTLNIRIKNVGMNTARKCFVKINSEILEEEYCFQVETGQGSKLINKDDSRLIELFLNFKSNKYKFNIKIYYQDLLFNWYEQKIVLDYELTQKFYNNKQINNKIIKILDEKLLDKEPILITNIEAINI